MNKLESLLKKIDGRGYKSYKDIKGRYSFDGYKLNILRVQGDPFASPSLLSCEIDLNQNGYDKRLYDNSSRKVAFEDYVLRVLNKKIKGLKGREVKKPNNNNRNPRSGSGKSGDISILNVGQQILKRSAVEIKGEKLIFRFYVGLPARGRTVLGREAKTLLFDKIADINSSLDINNVDLKSLEEHVVSNERSDLIRGKMIEMNLVAFIGEGSTLARQSSVDHRPMKKAVTFKSPDSMKVDVVLEDGRRYTGMGIKKGITTITGGGFHGKSTLLNALEMGVYNHIPKDGRELVITSKDAFKIRAEDGRSIEKTNITAFINNLPHKKDTNRFTTENASGSTSQACNIVEALELGSNLLLIDEDTSATNFMVRDRKIQELISHDKEPITPFIERVRSLKDQKDISTIIVVGGLGDYFSVSDKVLLLDEYNVVDITEKAREIDRKYSDTKVIVDNKEINLTSKKLNPKKTPLLFKDKKCKIKGKDLDELIINKEVIDIRGLEQLIENGQVSFSGEIIKKIFLECKELSLKETLDIFEEEIKDKNICSYLNGDFGSLVFTRKYEIGAMINRLRRELFL